MATIKELFQNKESRTGKNILNTLLMPDEIVGEDTPTGERLMGRFGPVGLMGSMYMRNQRKAGEERQKSEDLTTDRLSDLNAFYNSEYYKDFLNTAEARSAQSQLQTQLKDMLRGYENNAVSTGATPEARIAAKTRGQEGYSRGMNQILGLATQNKAGVRRDYTANANYLNSILANIYEGKAGSYEQVASNIANTGTEAIGTIANIAGTAIAPGAGALPKT